MGAAVSLATAPLSMMATCCGSLAGSCAASLCCRACSCSCVATTRVASIFYISVIMTFAFGAWFFRDQGGDIVLGGGYNATAASILDRVAHASQHGALDYWNKRFYCAPAHPSGLILCCANVCSGVFSVYRFSFTLCVFFALLTSVPARPRPMRARWPRLPTAPSPLGSLGSRPPTHWHSPPFLPPHRSLARNSHTFPPSLLRQSVHRWQHQVRRASPPRLLVPQGASRPPHLARPPRPYPPRHAVTSPFVGAPCGRVSERAMRKPVAPAAHAVSCGPRPVQCVVTRVSATAFVTLLLHLSTAVVYRSREPARNPASCVLV